MRHERNPGSVEAHRLLAQERLRPAPSDAFGARLRARVQGSLLGSPDGMPADPQLRPIAHLAGAKPLLALGLGLSLAGGAFYAWRRPTTPSPPPPTLTQPPSSMAASVPEEGWPDAISNESRPPSAPAHTKPLRPRAATQRSTAVLTTSRTKVPSPVATSDAIGGTEAAVIESARQAPEYHPSRNGLANSGRGEAAFSQWRTDRGTPSARGGRAGEARRSHPSNLRCPALSLAISPESAPAARRSGDGRKRVGPCAPAHE